MSECKGLVSVQCCNFEKDCKFRQDDDCYNPEVMKEALEQKLGMIQPKRKPLSDGTLPLTESEKAELAGMLSLSTIYKLVYIGEEIIVYVSPYHNAFEISNIKAILWLAERFNLNEEE